LRGFAPRNLASVYVETGRRELARQSLAKLVQHADSALERCRARLALIDLRRGASGNVYECDGVAAELSAADADFALVWRGICRTSPHLHDTAFESIRSIPHAADDRFLLHVSRYIHVM